MTQEEKDLLLADLCARLPYRVKVKFKVNEDIERKEKIIYNIDGEYSYITDGKSYLTLDIIKMIYNNSIDDIKPYLFPLESLTEEQIEELESLMEVVILPRFGEVLSPTPKYYDWLNKNNFDYRGLIPMGLATNATGLNIY